MELEALYNLKECLENAAVAGTDTLPDDPFLACAVDMFASCAEGLPVFEHIRDEARVLLSADDKDRPALLLDVLALVLSAERGYAASGASGTLTPAEAGDGSYVHAAYSQLQPIIAALCSTGSARLSILEEAWAQHPDYLADFRVLPYLADALGDTNEEFEELTSAILTSLGKRAVPFLKDGFTPDGKRAMARRVYWVVRLAGSSENDWYLSILPDSRKEVREAVIAALGASQENAGLLLALYPEEKGKCAYAVLRALARMEDEDSRAFWSEELERRPDCPPCLEGVDSPLAADMAAKALRDVFSEALAREDPACNQAQLLTLSHAVYAAYGKYSAALREEWLRCAEQIDAIDRLRPDRSVKQWDLSAAEMLEKCLLETVLWNPSEEVLALAGELAEKRPAHFLGAAVLAALITQGGEAFDRYGKFIVKNGLLRRESAAERANRIQIMRALAAVQYSKADGWHIPFSQKDMLTGAPVGRVYHLAQFDPRWAETLGAPKVNRDGAVFDLERPWSMTKRMFSPEDLAPPVDGAPPPAAE